MQQENALFQKIVNGSLGNVPFHKGRLYIIVNAYIAAVNNKYLDVFTEDELLDFAEEINSYLAKKDAEEINKLFSSFTKEELREIVLYSLSNDFTGYRDFVESSTSSIFEVAEQLLDIDGAGHIVADIGSGNGSVLANILIDVAKKVTS